MERTCEFCKTKPATEQNIFCEECMPKTCTQCEKEITTVYVEDTTLYFECVNNHQIDYHTVLEHLYEERLFNYTKKEQIQYGGNRTESIIPDSDNIIEIASNPTDLSIDNTELVLWHGTYDKDQILSEGKLKSLSELGADDELNDRYKGTLRYDSVFGWPFKYGSGPNDYPESDPIYFTVDFSDVVISFYTYLDAFQYGHITLDEYEDRFYFTPTEFLSVIEETDRPYTKEDILYFDFHNTITNY